MDDAPSLDYFFGSKNYTPTGARKKTFFYGGN